MSERHRALLARVEALEAQYAAKAARLLAEPPTPPPRNRSRRPRLQATPQGLAVLKETVVRLLASGDLWWSDKERPRQNSA